MGVGAIRAKYQPDETLDRLKKAVGRADWLIFRIMEETGLRVGDAVKIRGVDLIGDGDGTFVLHFVAEKTGKPGAAKLSPALSRALGRYAGKDAYIFPGRNPGTHITRQAIWARIKTAAKRKHIDPDGLSPHSFRKVAAVRERKAAGLEQAKKLLQHTNTGTAMLYAYADKHTYADEPITWGDLDLLAEFVIERMKPSDDVRGVPRPAAGGTPPAGGDLPG